MKNPALNSFNEPNSCGKICGLDLSKYCHHKCHDICHSGQCQPCEKQNLFLCYCKKTQLAIKCKDFLNIDKRCDKICERELDCGNHICQEKCHPGNCKHCPKTYFKKCFCGKKEKEVHCGEIFSCNDICEKVLSCGNHKCSLNCHEDECEECPYEVYQNERCWCGKKKIEDILGH